MIILPRTKRILTASAAVAVVVGGSAAFAVPMLTATPVERGRAVMADPQLAASALMADVDADVDTLLDEIAALRDELGGEVSFDEAVAAARASVDAFTEPMPAGALTVEALAAKNLSAKTAIRTVLDERRSDVDAKMEQLRTVAAERRAAVQAERAAREAAAAEQQAQREAENARMAPMTLEQALASLPFNFPRVIIGTCEIGLGGCYLPDEQTIVVKEDSLRFRGCDLRDLLAHEYRHHEQNLSGMYRSDGAGGYLNRDELEADANAFADPYGC